MLSFWYSNSSIRSKYVPLTVIAGVIPVLDVAAHSLQVPVRGGDGDGQLSPRDQGGAAQPHQATGRHILSSQPERVKYHEKLENL